MSTAVFEVAQSIPERVKELRCLTDLALASDDEYSSNTLCRACCVLLASHLEGFLKDLSSSLIADLAYNLKLFSNMPEAMKRTFCEKIAFYEGVPADEVNKRMKQLMDFFTANSVPIALNAFVYKENVNKNPGPDVVENMLEKMGVPAILYSISGGLLDRIFENEVSITYLLRRDYRKFRSRLYSFPYRKLPVKYRFDFSQGKRARASKEQRRTLWHTFIEEMMVRRHSIAHGDTMSNIASVTELEYDIVKLEVLMQAILYASAGYLGSKM